MKWLPVVRIVFLSLPVVGLFGLPFFLPIKIASCQNSTGGSCSTQIQPVLAQLEQSHFLDWSIRPDVMQTLVAPEYKLSRYRLIWPDQVQLIVSPNHLAYQLVIADQVWTVTTDGKLIKTAQPPNLVVVTTDPNFIQNDQVDLNWQSQILHLIQLLSDKQILVKQINWQTHHNSTLTLSSGQKVLFDEAMIDINLERLATLLKNQNTAGQLALFNTIDVRFRLPVLRK